MSCAKPGEIDQVGVAAELFADLPGNLRDLQRMGQSGPRYCILVRRDHLRLAGQPTERARMQHPGPVSGERAASAGTRRLRQPGGLGRFDDQPFDVLIGVTLRHRGVLHPHITAVPAPDDPPVSR